jgi:Cdc6-like AAA superfamily ATPase
MRWQSDSEATIFCPGIPGAGKTMVAAIAIDHLLRLVQSDSCGIAYVYCNYKVQHEQDAFGMLAAILKQLVQGKLSTIQHIEQLHKQHADRGTKPSVGDICNTLQAVLNHYPTVYIVIDALDECQESTRRQLLANLHDLRTGLDVRLMATSRFMPEIESSFEGALRLEIKATQEDVKRFVAGQLYSLPLCIRRDVELQELVQEKITEAVDGM